MLTKPFVTLAPPSEGFNSENPQADPQPFSMPRYRIVKKSSEKAVACCSCLSQYIDTIDDPVMRLCALCVAYGKECKVVVGSDCCGECVSLGQACDLAVSAAAMARVEEQFLKLRAEEEEMTKMKREVKARRDRLRKQIAALRTRHSGMVATELRNIEEQERDDASWADPSWVAASLLDLSSPADFPSGCPEASPSAVAPGGVDGSPARPSSM